MNILSLKATPLIIGLVLSLGAVWAGFWVDANHLDGAQLAARWTSRVEVPVFLTTNLGRIPEPDSRMTGIFGVGVLLFALLFRFVIKFRSKL